MAMSGANDPVTVPDHLNGDIYWTGFNPSLAAGFEGACYVRLHQPDKALDPLQQSLALCDPTFVGERLARTVDIGNVYAQLEDPRKACEALGQALDWIAQRRSLSGLRRVYKARAELLPWKKSAEVQALDDRLDQMVKALSVRT